MFFKILNFFRSTSASGKFLYKNFFYILKHSLKSVGGLEDDFDNFTKVQNDKRLQHQFSKVFYNSYLNSMSAARARDTKIIMRNGRNFRADIMFYSVVFGFIFSTLIIVFFKHKLSVDLLTFFSVLAGVCGGCLKEIFGYEFGLKSLDYKSYDYYILDEYDKPDIFEKNMFKPNEC